MAINWTTYAPKPFNDSPRTSDRAVVTPKGRVDFDFAPGSQFDPALDNFYESDDPVGFYEFALKLATGLYNHVINENPEGMYPRKMGSGGRERILNLANDATSLLVKDAVTTDPGTSSRPGRRFTSNAEFFVKQAVQDLWQGYVLLAAYALEDATYKPPFAYTLQRTRPAAVTQFGGGKTQPPPLPQTPAPTPAPGFGFSAPLIPPDEPSLPSDDPTMSSDGPMTTTFQLSPTTEPPMLEEDLDDLPDLDDGEVEPTKPASGSSSLPILLGVAAVGLLLLSSRKSR